MPAHDTDVAFGTKSVVFTGSLPCPVMEQYRKYEATSRPVGNGHRFAIWLGTTEKQSN